MVDIDVLHNIDEQEQKQEMCCCGRPIAGHYSDPELENRVRELCVTLGPWIKTQVPGVGCWMVPRHWIALHGLKGSDLKTLAALYDWPAATPD